MPEMLTPAGEVLAAAEQKKAYDEACKKVLAIKEIAARILLAVAEEFKDCTIDEIISCIEKREISTVPVDTDAPLIKLENSENSSLTEGTRFFDIKFTVRHPKADGEYISLIVNLEAQKDFSPGYPIIKRGLYYCSRLISSQYGTVFTKSDYGKIQKVYSIWVCTNPSEEYRNTVTRYKIARESIEGEVKFKSPEDAEAERRDYDLITLVLIGLGNADDNNLPPNGIVKFLSTIFSENIDFKAKISILEDMYDFKITEEIEEEVDRMCNLSEAIWEKGLAEGMNRGIAKGKAEGISEGIAKGIAKGISEGIAKGRAEGQLLQLTHDVEMLTSGGIEFDRAIKLLNITPDTADKIREILNK